MDEAMNQTRRLAGGVERQNRLIDQSLETAVRDHAMVAPRSGTQGGIIRHRPASFVLLVAHSLLDAF